MLEPIAATAAQAAPESLPLDFFFPFFFPGCGCQAGYGSTPVPLGAVLLVVFAFVILKVGYFTKKPR